MSPNPNEPPSPPLTPRELITGIVETVRSRLPRLWTLDILDAPRWPDRGVDAVVRIGAPNGEASRVIIQTQGTFEARDVPTVKRRIRDLAEELSPAEALMIGARYLNARVRERLEAEELPYADVTGNLYLTLTEPALYVRDIGAVRDPWRGPGRPRNSFRGPIAARVVRALVDFAPPITVPELVKRSEVSTGAGYRVVDFLEREDLVERQPRGPITRVEWRPILERWAEDYELDLEGNAMRMLAPRGIESVLQGLRKVQGPGRHVLTGSAAAAFFEEYARARMALIYTDSPSELAGQLELRPVESGANVLLARPPDDVVFARAGKRDGLQVAAPSQIAADLLNGPGRAPAEADALLDWMEGNESLWRC